MSPENEEIREQLSAYLDGELSAGEAERVAEALRNDPSLQAELGALRAVRGFVKQLPQTPAPAGMTEKVIARAERASLLESAAQSRGRGAGWWISRLAMAAAVLVAVGVGASVVAWLRMPSYRERMRATAPDAELAMRKAKLPEPTPAPGPADRAAGKVAGPLVAAADESADAATPPVTKFFINTDDLALAQSQVEKVFQRNSIHPAVATPAVAKGDYRWRSRVNVFNQVQTAPNRVRYEVAIDQSQLRRIISELNAIRAQQKVAQIPVRQGDLKDYASEEALAVGEGSRADGNRLYKRGMVARPAGRFRGKGVHDGVAAGPEVVLEQGPVPVRERSELAGAPTTRPAGAKPKRASLPMPAKSLGGDIALAARRARATADKRLVPNETGAGRRTTTGKSAPSPATAPKLASGTQAGQRAFPASVGVQAVPALKHQAHRDSLVRANVRQLVVILKGVAVSQR